MTLLATPRIIKVAMAGLDFGQAPDALETLLGSCVGVAIWDRTTRCGGLAHVVLPESRGEGQLPGKYADTAIPSLRQGLLSRGANPHTLQAKICGGARMFGKETTQDIGQKNIAAVTAFLASHKIPLVADHVAGVKGRVIRFSLIDGSIEVFVGRDRVGEI